MRKNILHLFVLSVILVSGVGLAWAHQPQVIALPDLNKPSAFVLDGQYFYVGEGASIYIYTAADYRLKKKFGVQGEGPGEFVLPPEGEGIIITPTKDSLLVNSMGKISFFTKNGEFIKDMRTPISTIGFFQPIGTGFAGLATTRAKNDRTLYTTINLYDKNCCKVKEIFRQPLIDRGRFEFPSILPMFYARNDRIIVGGEKNFIIDIFNKEGKKISSIKRDYPLLKMTDAYKEKIHRYFRTHPLFKQSYAQARDLISFLDYFPAISFFYATEKTIFVITFREEENKREVFVYDMDGKFIRQIFLPVVEKNAMYLNPLCFDDNNFYQLVENEKNDEWSLLIHPVK